MTTPAPFVWLASYPKSGNTWVRAIVTALTAHPHLFDVGHLGAGSQPFGVANALWRYGLDPRWLDRSEIEQVRRGLLTDQAAAHAARSSAAPAPSATSIVAPRLRKTHEIHRRDPRGVDPFPPELTRAGVLIVRDPRDVACSAAPFFGLDLDAAIDSMATDQGSPHASPARLMAAQPWGTWSTHTASWLADDVPFPVHLVRYEDLRVDAVGVLGPALRAVGIEVTDDELARAVEQARFDRMRESERRRGFREASPHTTQFFRRGEAGAWRDELTAAQVAAIEADHAEWMERLGYELTTDADERAALADTRRQARRRRAQPWTPLPAHLGIEVRRGRVPDEIAGAERPTSWMQTTSTSTRVAFGDRNAVWVYDGCRAVVQWEVGPDEPADADLSWIVQGWVVTLSMLQRGQLSLHASTVCIGDEVVALAGMPGAGKSTTAMGLRARGHTLLIDDTTLIEFRDGAAYTTPYSRNVHLLPDAADAVGLDFASLPVLAGRFEKAAFQPEEPPDVPHRIDRVVVLTRSPEIDHVSLQELRGGARVQALTRHVSRRGLAPAILGRQGFFERLARLADVTRVQLLRRPTEAWTLDAVMDAIESGASGGTEPG